MCDLAGKIMPAPGLACWDQGNHHEAPPSRSVLSARAIWIKQACSTYSLICMQLEIKMSSEEWSDKLNLSETAVTSRLCRIPKWNSAIAFDDVATGANSG